MNTRIAGYQMSVSNDVDSNTGKILSAIDGAADGGAAILLTPEGALSGYTHQFDASAVKEALARVTERARDRAVGLALGTCFVEDDGKRYDQLRFYRPDGEYLGFHSKILRCGTLESHPVGEINHYAASELRVFPWTQGISIGGLVCNDLWANPDCTPMPDPHLTQQLSDKGARIIFHAVNGSRDGSKWSELIWHFAESNLRMRARAGHLWIVTADNCNPEHIACSSPSGVIDPTGAWKCRTSPKGEELFTCDVTLDPNDQ